MPTDTLTLYPDQQRAMERIKAFLDDKDSRVFILKGYAGTGKTTLMKALIQEMSSRALNFSLLASTGRAAKILKDATAHVTSTVHGLIYKFNGLSEDLDEIDDLRREQQVDTGDPLLLLFGAVHRFKRDDATDCPGYYIIDEASMVSDNESHSATQARYGSGRLLADLLDYDDRGHFIFVGDTCQLPPLNQPFSPALSASYIAHTFDLAAQETELTQVVRQAQGNDIVLAAQKLRQLYVNPQPWKWAKFPLKGYRNITLTCSPHELLDRYIADVRRNGYNAATLIANTNRQCDTLTGIIRPALGFTGPQLSPGDLLLVTQNNYISGYMNGDLIQVLEVGDTPIRRAGLTFLNVTVRSLLDAPDAKPPVEQSKLSYSPKGGPVRSLLLIAEVLYGNQTNVTQSQQRGLLIDFHIRMREQGIKQKTPAYTNSMMTDPYLNALRCVFGYALTCHKAQGGEWEHVYLDIARNFPVQPKPFVYQWMYTAVTRAKKELFISDDFFII